MPSKREFFIAFSFYFFLALLFFSPILPGGKTFIPADVVDQNYLYPPREKKLFVLFERWEAVIHSYPNDAFYNRELKKGNLPLWNPYLFSGYPLFANGQNGFLNPFKLLFHLLLPPHRARELFLFLHLFMTGFFTFLFLRGLNLSLFPSLLGGFVWTYNSFNATLFQHEYVYSIAPYLPLLLLSYEKAVEERSSFWRGIGGLSLALVLLGRHLNYSFYACLAFLAFGIYRFFERGRWVALREFLIILFLGISISAVQLLPTFELIRLSSLQRPPEYHSLPWRAIVQFTGVAFFHPLVYDASFHKVNLYHPYNLYQTCGFAGNLAIFLSFMNIFGKERRKEGIFFFLMAVLFYLVAFYTPLTRIFEIIFPFVKKTVPIKSLYTATFFISIASAFGLESLLEEEKPKWGVVILSTAFVLLTGIIAMEIKMDSYPAGWFNIMNPALLSPIIVILLSGYLFTVSLSPFSRGFLALLISFSELFPLAVIYNIPVSSKLLKMEGTYFDFLKEKNRGYYRITGIQPNIYPLLSLQSVDGYDSLIPDLYFFAIKEHIPTDPADMRLIAINNIEYPIARLLGVKYVVGTDKNYRIPQEKLRKILDGDVVLYELEDVLPRTFVVGKGRVVEREIIRDLIMSGEDPLKGVLLEEDPGDCEGGGGSAEIISYEPERVNIAVDVNGRCGFLVLSDLYYPGWKAYVDGRKERIYRAYGFVRAVKVGEGKHTVEFFYRPLSFKIGAVFSVLGLLSAFTFVVTGRKGPIFAGAKGFSTEADIRTFIPFILLIPLSFSWYFYYREVLGMMDSRWNTVMAATLFSREKEEEGFRHLLDAVREKYVYPEAYLKMGLYLTRKNKFEEAILYLNKALLHYPALPVIYRALSEAYLYTGNSALAVSFAQTYYEMVKSHESALWCAMVYMKAEKFRDAFNFLRSVKKYYPDSPLILVLYGLANMAIGNTQDALFFWKKGMYLLREMPPEFVRELRDLLKVLPPEHQERADELLRMLPR